MKNTIYKGTATAMVTPMTPHGVDYDALGRLIDFQIENGIDALVAVGTTGESATLSPNERTEVIDFTVKKVNGRVPVIAGTGTNDTKHVIEYTKQACGVGADAVLVVTPYYNKATQNGLIAHFSMVADISEKPVILYNVPSRTGCNMLPATVAKLSEHPNIVGLKDACGSLDQVTETASLCLDKLDIYCGEDGITIPMMAVGAAGCISVSSNIVPALVSKMTRLFLQGNVLEAARIQRELVPLNKILFSEVNPIPAKAAISAMGFGEENIRLPLTPMEQPGRNQMYEIIRNLGVTLS